MRPTTLRRRELSPVRKLWWLTAVLTLAFSLAAAVGWWSLAAFCLGAAIVSLIATTVQMAFELWGRRGGQ
jgi:hypothetical protein